MTYQLRHISKQRADVVKRSSQRPDAVLLNTTNGYLIVEPVGSNLGDGEVLSPEEADYQLQPVWVPGRKVTLREARQRLGLPAEPLVGQALAVGV